MSLKKLCLLIYKNRTNKEYNKTDWFKKIIEILDADQVLEKDIEDLKTLTKEKQNEIVIFIKKNYFHKEDVHFLVNFTENQLNGMQKKKMVSLLKEIQLELRETREIKFNLIYSLARCQKASKELIKKSILNNKENIKQPSNEEIFNLVFPLAKKLGDYGKNAFFAENTLKKLIKEEPEISIDNIKEEIEEEKELNKWRKKNLKKLGKKN